MALPASDLGHARPSMLDQIVPAATIGIGGLPHRNARQAAEFALEAFDVPTIPSLPRRSPAESPIAQALVGVCGVALGPYGTVAVDLARLDSEAPVTTDIRRDQFVGFRTFLDVARQRGYKGPVSWHVTGPISIGVSLMRAGAEPRIAFDVGLATARSHLRSLTGAVSRVLPDSAQLILIDEPAAGDVMDRDFPLCRDQAIDVLSSAMASVEPVANVGVHCCRKVDAALLLEAGPHVLSLPVSDAVTSLAGHVDRFLTRGGWIAWGAVATGGPVGVTANRAWHQLVSLWQELSRRGCTPQMLRDQSLLSPECGLANHGVSTAERICHSLRDIGRSARSDATATKFMLGL